MLVMKLIFHSKTFERKRFIYGSRLSAGEAVFLKVRHDLQKIKLHTQWCSKEYGVQRFELQLLHMASIQNLQNRECQSGVLYSKPERDQTCIHFAGRKRGTHTHRHIHNKDCNAIA